MPPQPRTARRSVPRAPDADRHPVEASSAPTMPAASSRPAYNTPHNMRITQATKDRLAAYVFAHRRDDPRPTEQTITEQALDEWLKARDA